MAVPKPLRLAFYCSGHGYGHATRVTAVSCHLLTLKDRDRPVDITIVSTAPAQVFTGCLALGANYRYAEVDPVISQPVAYSVDRRKSLEVLRNFLIRREEKLAEEVKWIKEQGIECILSDAVFLACASANRAGIHSVLITNFTFDSNWSWLASDIPQDTPWATASDHSVGAHLVDGIIDDPTAFQPLKETDLEPLVTQMRNDYQCANLLCLLKGCIPIPSFSVHPNLPSTNWVSRETNSFTPDVVDLLIRYRRDPRGVELLPPVPFPSERGSESTFYRHRYLWPAPLIVRHPSSDIYTPAGRKRILDSIGVPDKLQDGSRTRILIVSFGGQKFRRPGSPSGTPSRTPSPEIRATRNVPDELLDVPTLSLDYNKWHAGIRNGNLVSRSVSLLAPRAASPRSEIRRHFSMPSRKVVTPTHLFIPDAPGPVVNPTSPIIRKSRGPIFPSQDHVLTSSPVDEAVEQQQILDASQESPNLLPPGWIAIVCGAGDDWGSREHLPEDIFIAPRNIYMPDLMVVGDVLLGKLGYGTCSEAIDSGTPFIYVPRPAIIEEIGLKLWLEAEGVGVEFTREKYESGDWAGAVQGAWERGESTGLRERRRFAGYKEVEERISEGDDMARKLYDWIVDQHQ
ncbi:uncharacterized protein EI90DRAFT_2966730 [Cantharellus anzutake]|uniref:uncharacterized protein n=1 Tax=Cantharellus anzutake TaxID=1750568 RepID=UPI0019063EC4|nr:uncharacterized protein EI90DRAFT_2966730 [Cantharellus anzutake]KAF8339585.1 hypothetical protein EI90DRAFT_2966730 [Cantharellus anzutake]